MARNVDIVINGKDHFTSTANKVIGSLNRMQGAAGRVGKGVGQMGAGFARVGLVMGTAVAGGLVAAAKAGADFESQLNTINTIARATPENLSVIGDGLRDLARKGRGDLADLSAGFYDVLSAGITDSTKALGVLDAASKLSIGGLSTNAQAVDILTTAINAYGQDASAAGRDADLFAKAIEIGKVKADEIAASFANVAPIAAQMGIGIEEIAAAYGALTAQGTPASEVTTQMQRAILDLLSPGKELLALQKKTKQNFMEIARDKGLVVALQAMRDAVKGDDQAFKDLFGRVEGYKFALQTTGPQQKIYNAALDAMGHSAGTAAGQMAERTQGLNFQLGVFKNNLIDAGITISSGFLPALSRALTKMSGALSDPETRAGLKAIGEDIGKALDNVKWDEVLAGAREFATVLQGALGFAKLMFDAVSALPGPIKEAGAGFLVLNKLSGGLIGAGAGNIAAGLAGGLARGAAAMLPGKAGQLFAQPVFVTNWAMMAGGGGLSGLAGGAAGAAGLGLASSAVAGAALLAASAGISYGAAIGSPAFARSQQLKGQTPALNAAEIAAIKYYEGDAAYQRQVVLHLGKAPSKADFESGKIKVALASSATTAKPMPVINVGKGGPPGGVRIDPTGKANAFAGIGARALAAGFHPSLAALQATFAKNEAHTAELAAAIRDQKPPQVTVNVNVSPSGVVNKYWTERRFGNTGTSRELDWRSLTR